MTINLPDGFIDIHDMGNTYYGETAHKLMHIANRNARRFNIDQKECLEMAIKAFKENYGQHS